MAGSPSTSTRRTSCVKLYLSSNPEDSAVERRALREKVFPKLREHSRHTLGLDVRVIDPFESSDRSRWPDENTRQQLIGECRESSAGPFLLALVGHQYGAACLPTQVEVSEYQLLLQESQQAGISTQELERAYQRDENSIPPSYWLRHTCSPQAEVKRVDEVAMKAEEEELRKMLQTSVGLCVCGGAMTPQRAQRYHRSALDADVRFALDGCAADDVAGRCLVYIHKVVNARGEQAEAPTFDPRTTPTDEQLLSELCDRFLPALVTSSRLLVFTTATECDRRHGYTTARRRGYAESLCQQVYADLARLIDSGNVVSEARGRPAMHEGEQEELCDTLSRFYDITRPEEEKVRAYVEQSERRRLLVVTGGPCTGKAVLLAHCAQQMKSWLPRCDPVVITYFSSLSYNLSPKHLLWSLCYQISRGYNPKTSEQNLCNPDCPSDRRDANAKRSSTSNLDPHQPTASEHAAESNPSTVAFRDPSDIIKSDICLSELKQRLSSLLFLMPSTKRPLVLVLDGLDHIHSSLGSQIIESLPCPLPPDVKVILSVSSHRTQLLQAISPAHRTPEGREEEWGYECVPLGAVDRKQIVKMLASLLSSSGRMVTSGQQALVNQALTSCCLTLYARLLHPHASLWRSDSDVTESSLPGGVHSSISVLLDHLEQKHGRSMVTRAISYLTLSRTGLTEAELADLLSIDNEVLSEYVQQGETPSCKMRVPQIDVERLLLDLRRFLVRTTVARTHVLFWVSRHFKLVAAKKYFATHEARREIHSAMVDYFSGRWTCGSAKPLRINQESSPNKDNIQMNIDIDRLPSSQPFIFTSSSKEDVRVNLRKVLELPYHLHESKKREELLHGLVMSLGFQQAMIGAGLMGDLVPMLEGEEWSSHSCFSREGALMASILKSCACLLQSSPLQLPSVMETRLLPYLEVFPALEGYMREIRQERRERGSGLGVALCPAPKSVPSIQCVKREGQNGGASVVEVAGAECGIVAEIMDDGTAWFWKGCGCDVVKLFLSFQEKELKFAGVRSSGPFMLLSTLCNQLFLWDVTGPEIFLQLKDPLKTEFESKQQTPNAIAGFVACRKRLFVWWRGESFVSVFDVCSETVTHFQCQSCVTCVACSSDGLYLYCGQEEGTLSVFDTTTMSLRGTCSNSNHGAVTLMMLREDEREIACVERTGAVTVWDVADKTPRVLRENRGGESENILNADFSRENNTLLVCHPHRVTMWDANNWELWDQFLAPRGKTFAHAVLSQDGHLLLASLHRCSSVLVWRVSTGECILSLETNEQPGTLLKMSSDVICVAHGGCLTAWDSEMIDVAAASPKMGSGVKEVLVDQTGEMFYTSDGSEAVWRWRLDAGLPHAAFLHDAPVGKLRLSPDGIHLVTLAAEGIYVWRADAGENTARVSDSTATDILITPNSNFAVSVSEQQLSRVWKLPHGSLVCSIHLYLSDAQVSPEGTFLIGRRGGDLLAANLWSGLISKRFSCVASSERVLAFHTLSQHADFVVVMGAAGGVFTWKVAEDTVCRHFQLPYMFRCKPQNFQMSSDGSYALLAAGDGAINLLDLSQVTLCSLKAEGAVVKACLDKSGCYVAYISHPAATERGCICSLHARPVLTVVRLADGEKTGSVRLPSSPSTLAVWNRRVFVGFEDGSVGVYSISDVTSTAEEPVRGLKDPVKQCPFDRTPVRRLPLATPNVTWP